MRDLKSPSVGMPTLRSEAWVAQSERGSRLLMRVMVWLSLRLGRRTARAILILIASYYLCFARASQRASAAYLARALGRPATLKERFAHLFCFASTIHDRIYLLDGQFDRFDIEVIGEELITTAVANGQGVLLMGAHLGSFEVARALGRKMTRLHVAMLMYEENARNLNRLLAAIHPQAVADIIALGRIDSMLEASQRLASGQLVGLLADRGFGNDRPVERTFLGAPAAFPVGPFRVAAILGRPILFMTGLYLGGNRYQIHFEKLADFSGLPAHERKQAMDKAQGLYVERLEHFCRMAPYNWFNFFDFWSHHA